MSGGYFTVVRCATPGKPSQKTPNCGIEWTLLPLEKGNRLLFVHLVVYLSLTHSLKDSGLVRQLHTHRPVLGHLSLQGCSNLSPDTLKIIGQTLTLLAHIGYKCGM